VWKGHFQEEEKRNGCERKLRPFKELKEVSVAGAQ
jgi:hypothetical protein